MIAFLACLISTQDSDIASLVRSLSDDSVEVRESAEEKLKSRGRSILPELRMAAADHPDPEVRLQIARVIRYSTEVRWHTDVTIARKKAAQEKKPLLVFSTMGPLDGYV